MSDITVQPGQLQLPQLPEEERQRADIYLLLAKLLIAPPDEPTLEVARKLKGGDGALGQAIDALAAIARAKTPPPIDDEYHELFIGLDEGELVPYASHYLKGALYDQPLVKLRQDMKQRGIGWDDSVKEPEDHISALCEMMAGLILGAFGECPATIEEQRAFYEAHIAPWAGDFFSDLQRAKSATFYMSLARIGAEFLAIESRAFQLAV